MVGQQVKGRRMFCGHSAVATDPESLAPHVIALDEDVPITGGCRKIRGSVWAQWSRCGL